MPEVEQILSYQRKVLYQNDYFEIVSINWLNTSVSKMHNHGWSQCMVLVEEGTFENTLYMGGKTEIQIFEAGQIISTPVGAKHEVRCLSLTGKTLHVYTPKIFAHQDQGIFKIELTPELKNNFLLSEPESIDSLKGILNEIREKSITTNSPYFMNQLFSGIMPQALLAETLVAETKTTLATNEASLIFSKIETEVIESLSKIIGWQSSTSEGICVPGGSAANFMAIHCARQKMFPDFKMTGMNGKRLLVFVSSAAHYSLKKACVTLGLGMNNLVIIPTDENDRMQPYALEQLINQHKLNGAIPLLVCATAGTTVFGSFDPIDELAIICKKYDIWLHADAVWGGPALFSKNTQHLLKGIEQADSVSIDAHKLFGASLTCSFYLSKIPGLLLEANDVSGGDYIFHSKNEIDRGKMSWQCGRKADAMSFWSIWKSLGTEGLGQFVDRLINVRNQTVEWVNTESRFEVVSAPDYLNLCLRINPPLNNPSTSSEWALYVRETLINKNLAMVNYAKDENGYFLRLIFAHPDLEFVHVKQILQWALEIE